MNRWLHLLFALFPLVTLAQGGGEDLLMPEQAFRLESTATPEGVRLEWRIAEGYYLYRDKFRFDVKSGDATLGQPSLPAGKVINDEFFGAMEIYRDAVAVDLPVSGAPGDAFSLEVTSQGCADIGVCYPPQKTLLDLTVPATAAVAPPPRPLLDLGNDEANEFLPPDEAFRPSLHAVGDGVVEARWQIAEGYYLYRDKFQFALLEPAGALLGDAELPPGKLKEDPLFGEVAVFHDEVVARLPVSMPADADRLRLKVGYQGCAEAGICYPPSTRELTVVVAGSADLGVAAGTAVAAASASAASVGMEEEPVAEQDRLATLLEESPVWAVLAFFVAGLLLAFTPCVFPMIPILSGIIVGQGSQITTRRAFTLSLVYVLAMAFTYTVAGVVAGLAGANIQAALQNPWVLTTFAGVFVALSLSMFGYYDLQIPASWQARLAEISNRQKGGGLIGVAVMGLLSALIVGPCVAPPLAGALIVIGQKGDPVLGGVALFALSMGMGAPLVAMGTLEGKVLPRAGAWMNAVKHVFGVLMLAVALYLLDRVLPGVIIMLLWAALLIVSAIYMGALEPLGKDASGYRKLWKGLGLVLMGYGALLLVGASGGNNDLFQPLKGMAAASSGPGGSTQQEGLQFRKVKGVEGLEAELQAAAAQGKPVMLDFYADWCISCVELERFTWPDPEVQKSLEGVVLLKADVTANDDKDKALLKEFGLFGPPAILFFGPDGEERRGYRLVGFINAEDFTAHARKAVPDA